MASEWPVFELSELSKEITVGFVGSMTHEYVESGIPFLRSKNIDAHTINWDDIRYVSPEFHAKLKKSELRPGDVAIVRTGKPGTTCVIPETLSEANCSDLVIVRVDKERLDAHFLSYFMNSVAAGAQVNSHVVGAVQQHFNVGSAKKIIIHAPSIEEQKKVVGILKTLDDKIQLNRQTNQTLESMAQALFKSWFVDFDPVIDNALVAGNAIPEPLQARAEQRKALRERSDVLDGQAVPQLPDAIRQLFPKSFVLDAEMGWVPEGWQHRRLDSIASVIDPHPSHRAPKEVEVGFAFAGIGDIDEMGNVNVTKARTISEEAVLEQESCYTITNSSVGFGRVGTVGKVVRLRPQDFRYALSPTMAVINPLQEHYAELTYCLVKSQKFLNQVENSMTGSTRPAIGIQVLRSLKLVLPEKNLDEILSFFSNASCQWIKVSDSNNRQIATLTKLRDTLLPKLISGELRIPEAAQAVQELETMGV